MKILIIEDELIWQLKLQMMIEKLLPEVQIVLSDNCFTAQLQLKEQRPDIIISDIMIDETPVFDLLLPPYNKFPIVFITEFPNAEYYRRAEVFPNSTFLVKPFHEFSLKSAISVVARRAGVGFPEAGRSLPVLDKYRRHLHLPLTKVVCIESDGNYSIVYSTDQKYIIKKSLTTMSKYLDEKFVQVQKSFIINTMFINQVEVALNKIDIYGQVIPIGRTFRKNFLDFWRENGNSNLN